MSSDRESHELAREVNRGRRRQLFRWSAAATVLVVSILAATLIVISVKANDLIDRFGNLRSRVEVAESSLADAEARLASNRELIDDLSTSIEGFLAELRKAIRQIK